jgi:hypothetical protein
MNGSWWYAIADYACGAPLPACQWGSNQNTFGTETRVWSATTPCAAPPAVTNWETASANWEAEPDNWETV